MHQQAPCLSDSIFLTPGEDTSLDGMRKVVVGTARERNQEAQMKAGKRTVIATPIELCPWYNSDEVGEVAREERGQLQDTLDPTEHA